MFTAEFVKELASEIAQRIQPTGEPEPLAFTVSQAAAR
jgi:hypothetical protein